ncbi:hypothetical protein NE261_05185 [Enterococcus italicus]|uniref:hypothetical protein n=1 Tax=Enterococcus italicus TaxID=246144 RepID=UPI00207419A8|nr:hypothetical protein [Enterococcus italicus]MCM6931202.1 hypothetical protein [Enterococcus italicus]
MKKTNFFVVFWLLIALISFITFLIFFHTLWDTLSYLLFPATGDEYMMSTNEINRSLFATVPMILLVAGAFAVSLKNGLKLYYSL